MTSVTAALTAILFSLSVWVLPVSALAETQEERRSGEEIPEAAPDEPAPRTPMIQDYDLARLHMIAMVRLQLDLLARQSPVPPLDERLESALDKVPRHAFVPAPLRHAAYLDTPLPVAPGATVSQPFITTLMVLLAQVRQDDAVLQIAAGGGYQTALLAELSDDVRALEFHPHVVELARENLRKTGYGHVTVEEGDGYYGWPGGGAFDVIIVRLAMPYVPDRLLAQLRPGGRMVVPVGPTDTGQYLTLIVKDRQGRIAERRILDVRFQPLPGGTRL